jgi:hypothetical protein
VVWYVQVAVQSQQEEADTSYREAAPAAPQHQQQQGVAQQKESLLVATARNRKEKPEETEAEKRIKEEEEMLRAITQRAALKSVKELAKVGSQPRAYMHRWPRTSPCVYRLFCRCCHFQAAVHGRLGGKSRVVGNP